MRKREAWEVVAWHLAGSWLEISRLEEWGEMDARVTGPRERAKIWGAVEALGLEEEVERVREKMGEERGRPRPPEGWEAYWREIAEAPVRAAEARGEFFGGFEGGREEARAWLVGFLMREEGLGVLGAERRAEEEERGADAAFWREVRRARRAEVEGGEREAEEREAEEVFYDCMRERGSS